MKEMTTWAFEIWSENENANADTDGNPGQRHNPCPQTLLGGG